MARYLGDAAGRASKQYTDTTVAQNCSQLCSYVNTLDSATQGCLGTKLNATGGDASGLSNVVNSLTAGSGITVNASTGAITISSQMEGAAEILYNCACCWNGGLCIPADKAGAFTHYELFGYYRYFEYYCSHATICFTPWPGCNQVPHSGYCCYQCSCGWMGANKCFWSSTNYGCGGNIAWAFGCESGCRTACNAVGAVWHARVSPSGACIADCKGFHYCFNISNNGGGQCCIGIRNAGYAENCCGMHPACMKCFCVTTPGGSRPFSCRASVVVVGYGRLT